VNPHFKRNLLRLTYGEGFFFALMVASSEAYALFYFTKKGLGPIEIALMSTLPLLFGAFTQYLIPKLLSDKQTGVGVLACIVAQILGIALLIECSRDFSSFALLLTGLTLYWVGGATVAPLWLDWVARLCGTNEDFSRFLARRNTVIILIIMVFYFSFSLLIDSNWNLSFTTLFSIGLVARIVSFAFQAYLTWKAPQIQHTQTPAIDEDSNSEISLLPELPEGEIKKALYLFFFWTALFRFCVNLSAPFFLPYMINELEFTTVTYALLTSLPLLSRAIFLSNWSRQSRGFDSFRGIQISCLFIAIMPLLWTFNSSIPYLATIEFFGGIFWGGFELMAILMVHHVAPKQTRTLLGLHMASMTVMSVLGAMCAGALLSWGLSYHELFWLSSITRLAIGIGLVISAARFPAIALQKGTTLPYLSSVLSLRPSVANIGRIIIARKSRP
jgi:hypothetical protein